MASPSSCIPPPGFCYTRPPMILTRDVILAEIAKGRLAIEPLAPEQVGPASIDLHLGDEIRVFDDGTDAIEVTEDADYRAVTRVRRLDDAYLLKPGETIHAITRERLRLPPDISGWLEGRSRFARLGLMVHVTSVAFSREQLLFCRTRVLSLRQAIAIAEGEVTTSDGTLVAKALGTFGVRRA